MPEDNRPATKQDVHDLEDKMRNMEERFTGKLRDTEERLVETMRDMQTEVPRAFHNWGRPAEIKRGKHS